MTETLIKKMFIEKWDGIMPKTTAGNNMMMLLDDSKKQSKYLNSNFFKHKILI